MMINTHVVLIRIISLVVSCLWVVLLSFALPVNADPETGFSWHAFLIATQDPMYPVNVQVLMWIAFFYCLGEVAIKGMGQIEQQAWLESFSLYHNPSSVNLVTSQGDMRIDLNPQEALKPEILAAIFYAKRNFIAPKSLIGKLFKKINHQFQSTNDVGDVYSAVNSDMEMRLHEVDLSYTVIRYLAWLIPTLGFIGTVIGIALALGKAAALGTGDPELLEKVIPMLATAFYTTLLALILSALVMILIQILQAKEERLINHISTYCMDNIVTNLKPSSLKN